VNARPLTPVRGLFFWRDRFLPRTTPQRRRPPLRNRGFSALELVVVIAVTAIIGALGTSALRTYLVRKQVIASLAVAASIQERVAKAFRTAGVPPADWHSAGFPVSAGDIDAEYVEAIDIADGRVEIRFGRAAAAALAQRTLSLTPFETADMQIVWICGNQAPGVGLEPLGFTGGSGQAAQLPTTIERRYLPSTCR
jgi:type IV pilus assembly protein PilA